MTAIVQARAETVGQILFAYFQIPGTMDSPLDLVVNPEGNEARSQQRWATTVWLHASGMATPSSSQISTPVL